jgi:hypothetical protein
VGPRYLRPIALPAMRALRRACVPLVTPCAWRKGAGAADAAAAAAAPAAPLAFIATSASTFGYPTQPPPLLQSAARALGVSEGALPTPTRTRPVSLAAAATAVVAARHIARHASGGLTGEAARRSAQAARLVREVARSTEGGPERERGNEERHVRVVGSTGTG